jgi:steroid 5-alpha reductase family enzyme
MTNKQKALIEISIYYIIITLSGWFTYYLVPNTEEIFRLLYADLAMTVVTFIFSIIKKNSSVYDAYWSVIPFLFVLLWSLQYNMDINKILIFASVSFWSWRLTLNWARGWEDFSHEDWRYINLANQTGKMYPFVNLLGIHLFPTIMVFGCCMPLFYAFESNLLSPIIFYSGLVVSLIGTILELIADNQLARFKKRLNPGKGEILSTGLWGVVRYPNYLGEMTFWVGCAIMGKGFDVPWYSYIGVLALIAMFIGISIPMKEKRMAERRKKYNEYQNSVPLILPFTKF